MKRINEASSEKPIADRRHLTVKSAISSAKCERHLICSPQPMDQFPPQEQVLSNVATTELGGSEAAL
jgi:hypothetical protein